MLGIASLGFLIDDAKVEQKFDEMRKEIWIDIGCLLLAVHVFFGSIVAARSASKEEAAGEAAA